MNKKRILSGIILVLGLFFMYSEVQSSFDGDVNDFDDVVKYFDKNIDDYHRDLSTVKNHDKQREIIALRKEMERLVLKIDAGDISNEKLRKKIITLRRGALKKKNRDVFVINNFDRPGNNRLGGSIGIECDGERPSVSPWIDYSFRKDSKRSGKKVMYFEYDITEGPVLFFNDVNIHYPFKRNNAFEFKIKSDSHAILVQIACENDLRHDYVVSELTGEWQTVIISFEQFGNYELFDYQTIKRVNFILRDDITEILSGSFSLNDLVLKKIGAKGAHIISKHNINYEVEGTVPLGTNKSFIRQK